VPVDLGGMVATMTDGAYYRLKDYLKIDGNAAHVNSWYTVDVFDERILERFGVDFRRVFLKGSGLYNLPVFDPDGTYVNEWGIRQRRVDQEIGHYAEMISTPLRNASMEDIDRYPWPDPYDPERTKGLRQEAEHLFYDTDYAISAAAPCGGLFELGMFLCGFDQFPVDMMLNKDRAVRLIEEVYEVQRGFYEVYLGAVGEYIEMIEMHDDYGMQTGLLISPTLYREIIKPYHSRLIEFIKSKTRGKVFHHTCGSVVGIIDELIDSGIDILNPLQPAAAGMGSPEQLKKRYGERICFHGGIDEQYILPRGTQRQVEQEVKSRIKGFAPGGGYILAAAHNIQVDVPPENIITMFESARKFSDRCCQ
jgi:uroporphyrinogen decarboxylase